METGQEQYCVRWKGFHSNIVSALEDLKTDEEFVDVTLSCGGQTIQGHKVVLSACSPYFKKLLKDNPCRHPVLILNDIHIDILEALMTYMYHGTVSVSQNKLQVFLNTAESMKIKGIIDPSQYSKENGSTSDCSSIMSPPPGSPTSVGHQELTSIPTPSQHIQNGTLRPSSGLQHPVSSIHHPVSNIQHPPSNIQHPAGDLTLLASAAAESSAQLDVPPVAPNPTKRRKAAPRKLGSYVTSLSPLHREPHSPEYNSTEDEGMVVACDTEKENNNAGLISAMVTSINKACAINLSTNKSQEHSQSLAHSGVIKQEVYMTEFDPGQGSLDLTIRSSGNNPMKSPTIQDSPPHSNPYPLLPLSLLPTSSTVPPNLLSGEGVSAADQMAALLGPEQMAAILGPSWKSRQPRMCQYCQRMFSNKFNLKQHILNMHTVGRELQCEICAKKVKNKWYLRRHHVTHHGAPLKK